jgi:hypothetical protein
MSNKFNSIQYFNGLEIAHAVYWRDPINIKSTSQDKKHLVKVFTHCI